MTTRTPKVPTGVHRAQAAHVGPLSRFFTRVWDSDSTPEKVSQAWEAAAAGNVVEPGAVPPSWVFLRAGEVIGYLSTLPARFQVAGGTRIGHWLKGLWVLPEHRGGPVGFHLVRAAAAELDPLASLAVAEPARRLFEAVGFRDAAQPPNYLWPVRPGRLAGRLRPAALFGSDRPGIAAAWSLGQRVGVAGLAGVVAGGLLRARRPRQHNSGNLELHLGWEDLAPEALDQLWAGFGPHSGPGLIRDASYLMGRYGQGRQDDYRPLIARARGEVLVCAVLRRPMLQEDGRMAGVQLSWLSELIFDPTREESRRAASRVVREVERMARKSGADLLASSFSGAGFPELFRELGHIRRSPTMHLLLRGLPAEGEWVVARGDGNSDGAA